MIFRRRRLPRNEVFKINTDTSMGGFVPDSEPSISPSPTPTNTVTPSITPSVTPTITSSVTPSTTVTPSITVSPSITSSLTPTPSITPSVTLSPSVTPTRTLTPTPTQFCKRFTGVQTTIGNGSTYNYTACNNQNGTLKLPNSAFGSTVTIYSRSGAPTKSSGTGVVTWTDQGFGNPCSGSTFTQFSTNSGINSEVDVTDCGGATYKQVVSQSGPVAGCFTSYTCTFTCGTLITTSYGSCST